LLLACVACGSSSHTTVKPGDDHDEGAGILARASTQLGTGETAPDKLADNSRGRYGYGGTGYGGDPYGGDPYGGTSYAHWTMPTWNPAQPNRQPHYTVAATGLDGVIEGNVTWSGAAPTRLTTPCGAIDSAVRVGANRELRGALVFIERVAIGRTLPMFNKPLAVGGVVTKRGCALVPAAQIAIPLPTSVSIHGDTQRTRVRIAPVGTAPKLFDLQEGGLVQTELKAGVTKIDGEDGKLGAAWIVSLETPYYAITDDGGHYRIEQLAAGSYEVTFWQAPTATVSADGTLVYGAPIVAKRTVRVDGARPAQLSIALPAR
jgi:hypothetical protein